MNEGEEGTAVATVATRKIREAQSKRCNGPSVLHCELEARKAAAVSRVSSSLSGSTPGLVTGRGKRGCRREFAATGKQMKDKHTLLPRHERGGRREKGEEEKEDMRGRRIIMAAGRQRELTGELVTAGSKGFLSSWSPSMQLGSPKTTPAGKA